MKKIIALAVAAAFTAPVAFADVELGPFSIYGTAATAVEVISVENNTGKNLAPTADSQTRLMDQTSKLGFKAKYDLGNDFFALAQVESRFYLGNNGDNTDDKAEIGSRNTFVGIGGKQVGTLRLGRYDNAYKLSLKQIVPTLYGNLNDASSTYGSKQILNRLGARQGDMVAYETPDWSGFSGNLSYNFGKDSTNSISSGSTEFALSTTTTPATISKVVVPSNTPATDLMGQVALGIAYKHSMFNVGFGYTSLSNAAWKLDGSSGAKAQNLASSSLGGTQKLEAYQLGGQVNYMDFSAGAVFERTSSSVSGQTAAKNFDQTQNVFGLIAGYKKDALEVQVQYAKANDVDGTTTTATGGQQASVAVGYQVHKYVQAVASFTKVHNQTNASFTSASGFALAKSNGMNQFALGLVGKF
ncbi:MULTISPECIES: porin [unclassified Iodobacter]|uniref:porin n=1 Tax=unclassified Iodobacter TaxID=235634 RepID=UPI0025D5EE00|nr:MULTISPECIES: porin [unclassified Iodobacter]MDW5417473.1 porin [Iodobacter sp. CM08]